MSKTKGSGLGIAGVVLVVLVLAGLLSVLMPGLRSAKFAAGSLASQSAAINQKPVLTPTVLRLIYILN